MYSTTHSIMYPNARHHSLYPFLNEIIVREDEAPPYDIEGMDVYPDSEEKLKMNTNHQLQDYKPARNKNSLL